jgi:hypothetical protein
MVGLINLAYTCLPSARADHSATCRGIGRLQLIPSLKHVLFVEASCCYFSDLGSGGSFNDSGIYVAE